MDEGFGGGAAGMMGSMAPRWSCIRIVSTFGVLFLSVLRYLSLDSFDSCRYTFGPALFVGWIGGAILVIGGVMMCLACRGMTPYTEQRYASAITDLLLTFNWGGKSLFWLANAKDTMILRNFPLKPQIEQHLRAGQLMWSISEMKNTFEPRKSSTLKRLQVVLLSRNQTGSFHLQTAPKNNRRRWNKRSDCEPSCCYWD